MKIIAAVIALLFPCTALHAGTPTTRMSIAAKMWDEQLAKADGKPIVSDCYPTEAALVFLTAYDFTRAATMPPQAVVQLDYSHGREVVGLFVTRQNVTTRDYQARQIYNFYLAYRILGDG